MNEYLTLSVTTEDDIEEYLQLLEKFHSKSTVKDSVKFDYDSCKSFLLTCLSNPDIVVLNCKDNNKIIGITAGLLFPLYFNHNYFVVQELWWWLDEDYRGKGAGNILYNALEQWAKDKKANGMFMIALEDDNVEAITKIYKSKGYTGTERTFIKELNNGN